MKRVCFLLLLFSVVSAYSQTVDTILLRAYYMASFQRYQGDRIQKEEKVLDIGKRGSCFYGRWQRVREHIQDSIIAGGGSYNDILAFTIDYPNPREFYAVYKNCPKKGTLLYTDRLLTKFHYEEPMEKPQWRLLSGDTLILGYRCQKADCTFRGRTWRACYTMDIPLSEGPWKLYGLPGLILYAEDDSGIFRFECIELADGKGETVDEPELKSSMKCARKELMQQHKDSWGNPFEYVKQYGIHDGGYTPDGKPVKYKTRIPLFLEQ